MKNTAAFILSIFTFILAYSQTAEELNQQSRELLRKNEIKEAIPLLKKAAELGSPEAQYNLGYAFQNGLGMEKDMEQAVEWYKKSSDNKFNDAYYAMMMAYGNGEGVKQNLELAFDYALKCANNDDPTCMWNVVNSYAIGNGVKKDDEKVKEWIVRLAKLNNPENLIQSGYITSTRLQLARFYKNGKYFDKDLYQSYLWYIIFNESKRDFSLLQQQEAIDEIKELEKKLAKEQIKNGGSDAEKLLGRKIQNLAQLHKTDL